MAKKNKKHSKSKEFRDSSLNDLFNGCNVWSCQVITIIKAYLKPFELIKLFLSTQQVDLTPSKNNAVLFQLPLSTTINDLPQPHPTGTAWDQKHVRLPCAVESQVHSPERFGNQTPKSRWTLIEDTLRKPIRNCQEMELAIKTYNKKYKTIWNFLTLHKLFEFHYTSTEVKHFFDNVLPKLIDLALELPQLIQAPIPLLKQGMNNSISMSQQQAACLLANAFLCTFPQRNSTSKSSEYSSFPEINFSRLFSAPGQNVIEKLKCILNYFHRVLCVKMPTNVITYQRKVGNSRFKWQNCNLKLSSIKFHVTTHGKIEESHGMLQVESANRYVGGGVFGSGCFDEEIRFVINPEMIVAKLFTESFNDNEALIMIGCEQFNVYDGYATSFRWTGDFVDKTPTDLYRRRKCQVVAIDSLMYTNIYEQFDEKHNRRELNKALAGFRKNNLEDKAPIASGLWGCNIFNGNPVRTALIQLMACTVVHRNIAIFTYGATDERREIADIFHFLTAENITVGELYKIFKKFESSGACNKPNQLTTFIKRECNSTKEEKQGKTCTISQIDDIFNPSLIITVVLTNEPFIVCS